MKKNKIYFLSLCLLVVNICIGQNIKCTKVLYKIGKPQRVMPTINSNINPEAEKMFDEMHKAFDKVECELFFTKEISIFKIIEKSSLDEDFSYKLASGFVSGLFYKNLQSNEKIKHRVSFGQTVNIVLPFEEYIWEITTETRIISGYVCYKAKTKWEDEDKVRGRVNVFYPEVWFTPKIPASFGPNGLDGLPGLVLEGKISNSVYFYAVKIDFDVLESSSTFLKPEKGKFYTQDEYQNFSSKAMENMQIRK